MINKIWQIEVSKPMKKITKKGISETVRGIAVASAAITALITKDVGNAFYLVVGISGVAAILFSPGYSLNTAVFNFFENRRKESHKK